MYLKKTTKYGNRIDTRKYHTFKCPGKTAAGPREENRLRKRLQKQMSVGL